VASDVTQDYNDLCNTSQVICEL